MTYQLASTVDGRMVVEWNKHPPPYRVILDGHSTGYWSEEAAMRAARRLCKRHGLTLKETIYDAR